MSQRKIAESEKNLKSSVDYEKNFILSLQDIIVSLERQLEQKQEIIEKLLEEKEYSWPNQTDSKALKGQASARALENEQNSEVPHSMARSKQQKGKKPSVNLSTSNSNDDEHTPEYIRKTAPEESKQRNG